MATEGGGWWTRGGGAHGREVTAHNNTKKQLENEMGTERGGGANKDNGDGECEVEACHAPGLWL